MKKLIVITEFGTIPYSSINEASRQTGISRTRISRALNHNQYGYVANTEPPVCVDLVDEDLSYMRKLPSDKCLSCPYLKGDQNG